MANILSWLGNQAGKVEKQLNPFDNGATYSNPNPTPQPPNQQPDLGQRIFNQINPFDNGRTFKNALGNGQNQSVLQQAGAMGRGIIHPFSTFGSALAHVPQALYREVQNKPIYDIQKNVFGTTNQGNIAKQIIGDTATIGLTAAAPGISEGAGSLTAGFLPNAESKAIPGLLGLANSATDEGTARLLTNLATHTPITSSLPTRLVAGALANEGVNTGFNVAGQVASGQPINIKQAAKQGIGPTAIGIGSELTPALKSTVQDHATALKLDENGGINNLKDPYIKEYADYLKSMGQGNGVSITSDGRRISNNVRTAATKGKNMTNADWYNEAANQLKTGKADSAFMDYYKTMNDPAFQSLAQTADKSMGKSSIGDTVNIPQATKVTPKVTDTHLTKAQALVDAAQKNNPTFHANMQEIAKQLGLNYKEGPVKSAARIAEKAVKEDGGNFNNIKDAVRGTMHVPDLGNTKSVINAISNKYDISRIKALNSDTGYSDVKVNIKHPDGSIGEVILTTPEMAAAKKIAHTYYKEARNTTNAARLEELHNLQKQAYLPAQAATAKRLASSSDISRPSETALAGGKGLPEGNKNPLTTLPSDTSRTTLSSTSTKRMPGVVKGNRISQTIPENTSTVKTPRLANSSNPIKVSIPEVKQGDYAQARINPQLASNPIDFAAGQAIKSVKKLGLSTSEFGKMVENPSLAKTAAEKEAVARYNELTNRAHATSQALGGNTNYIKNYFHHEWDLSNPEDAAKFDAIAKQSGSVDPFNFNGINSQPRVFKSIKQGEAAGFKLANTDPVKEIQDYAKGNSYALRQQALAKGFTEADMGNAAKPHSFDMGNGNTLPLSDEGIKQIKGYSKTPEASSLEKGYKAINKGAKQTLLSASEFHPINISLLKAGPAEALAGHPLMAARGVYDTFRSQIGSKYSDRLQQSALKDGTVEAGARLGTPIKFGSDYANEGKLSLGKSGVGEHTIFEKSMPAMHIQLVKAAVKDLEKRNIPLDSPEAHALGTRINEIMGFVNNEVRNLDPRQQRALSNVALAPQFTRAKWATVKGALTEGGLAGKYARRAVIGNTLAVGGISAGLGAALNQKSDNWKDTALRALVHPSVSTPLKDGKGNTIELGLPSTYISELLGLGTNLTRNNNRLGIEAKPGNILGNLANYGRSRLAVIPSTALKVATNTDYAGKPLYDPQASAGVKTEQAATTVTGGLLPIGLQGLLQNNAVKSHLPGNVQDVLNANTPGTNPLIKSVASSFGLTPRTDKTVGKGLQTTQYFNARDDARNSLNANDKAAFDTINPASKNPVTQKYQTQPTVWDGQDKATLYLSHPNVLKATTTMNQKLAQQGQNVDPFFTQLNPKQQSIFLTYSTLNQQDPQKTAMVHDNPWITAFQSQRANFFSTLPASDPNKPKSPVAYPQASSAVSNLQNQYYKLSDPAQKAQFLNAHPEVANQFAAQDQYNRQIRAIKNLPQYDNYPTASPQIKQILDTFNSLPKNDGPKGGNATRNAWMQNHPAEAAAMNQYLTQTSLYNLQQSAQQAAFQNQGFDQKGLKAISGLGKYDISKTTDANGNTIYALAPGSGSNNSYGKKSGVKLAKYKNSYSPKIGTLKTPKFKVASVKAPHYRSTLAKAKIPNYGYKPPKVSRKLA